MNEQRSNIKAFERTVRNFNIKNFKEKWQLEDKLRTVTQRCKKVDSTYWKLDNILVNTQAIESDYNRLERLYEFSKEQINKRIWDYTYIHGITNIRKNPPSKLNFRFLVAAMPSGQHLKTYS